MSYDVPSPQPTPTIETHFSATEVAERLHIAPRTARRLLRLKQPGVRFGDRTERWPLSMVQDLIAEHCPRRSIVGEALFEAFAKENRFREYNADYDRILAWAARTTGS